MTPPRLFRVETAWTAVLLCLVAWCTLKPIDDPDLGWHLAAAEHIVDGPGFPWRDPYSHLGAGKAWMAYSWLPEVLFLRCERAFGPAGMVVLAAGVVAVTMLVVMSTCRAAGARPQVAVVAAFLAALASWPCWTVRPHLFSFLAMALFADALARARRPGAPRPWVLVPITALWANCHVLFVLGLGLFGLHALARGPAWWRDPRNLALGAAIGAATLATPYGWHLPWYVVALAREPTAFALVTEFQTPSLHEPIGLGLAASLLATVAVLVYSPREKDPGELLAVFVFAFLALLMARNVPFWAIVAAPVLARHLDALLPAPRTPAPVGRPQRLVNAALVLGAAGWIVLHAAALFAPGAAVRGGVFPEGAVAWLRRHPAPGRLLNGFNWGGWLIRALHPHRQVAIDGRTNLYDDAILAEYRAMAFLEPDWRRFLDRTDPGVILWDRRTPFARLLALLPEWRRAYEDDVAVVYVRRAG